MDYLTIFVIAVFAYAVLVALTYISFKVTLESAKIRNADKTVCADENNSDEPDVDIEKE